MAVTAETNLFTTSVSWGGQETLDAFLKPHYVGMDLMNTPGIRVIPDVPGSIKLNLFDVNGKKTKAYAAGFNGSTGDTYTQKTLSVADMKAEAAFSNNELKNTVYRIAMNKGYQLNDITGTVLQDIYMEIWMRAVKSDLFRQAWLGDTTKTTLSSTYFSGTADTDYNAYNGIWAMLMTDAATTTPSASGTHIYRKEMDHNATAQVSTVTITSVASAGGNLVLTVNGTAYSQVYATSLTATAAAFVTSHAANILARHKVTVTSSGAALTFTSAIKGLAHVITVASASAVAASGGVVATTANVAPTALAADEALTYMKDLFENSYAELVGLPANEKVFYVDQKVYHNLLDTYEDSGTYTELGKTMLMDGVEGLSFRGVPVLKMNWNTHLAADFAANYYDEGRIIYTALDNIVCGIDGQNPLTNTDMVYSWEKEQNMFRTRYFIGFQYYSNKLTSVSY